MDMAKNFAAATICPKCGQAVWKIVYGRVAEAYDCEVCSSPKHTSKHNHIHVCNNCGEQLDLDKQKKTFCPYNARTFHWHNDQLEGLQATHVYCVICSKEDRALAYTYDFRERRTRLWSAWRVWNFYGITKAGKMFMAEAIFCRKHVDVLQWLKEKFNLLEIKSGHATPHLFGVMAKK